MVCCGPRDTTAPTDLKEEKAENALHRGLSACHLEKIGDIHMEDFTLDNMGRQVRKWLEFLALPLPVTISLLTGGFWGSRLGFYNFIILVVVFFGISPVIYSYVMKIAGRMLKELLEKVDQDYLGVDIHIGDLDLSICSARFVIKDFVIDNPKMYKAEYLLKVKQVVIDIDMAELIMSKGQKIVIEEFMLDEIDVIMEYDSVVLGMGKSNFDWVMEFMANRDKKDEDDLKKPKAKAKPDGKKKEDDKKKTDEHPAVADGKEAPKRETVIEKVQILDVGARVQSSVGLGQRAALADIRYKHFTKQFGKAGITGIISILLKSIMKSLIANVFGKAMADKSL